MKILLTYSFSFLLLSIGLVGCGDSSQGPSELAQNSQVSVYGLWSLQEIDGQPAEENDPAYLLVADPESVVGGQDCFFGATLVAPVDGDSSLQLIDQSIFDCFTALDINSQQASLNAIFSDEGLRFSVTGDSLEISLSSGETYLFRFVSN